ncbi:PAAR motif family protein [Xanthomonas oryzae pv. oryzae]|nr:PAAR domain-containing protein [Xanthomonas oryzae]OLG54701.1 PAAR motif family protein [Xanthomonas oryzae pv. oryzae]OLH41111.1 PAAR motif family protein [Xanthomonas oryzae pv. oryzae]OLH88202.1 PAAR motif family protein [Xanthomonas oryzae pv. oryzae]OLI41354.1 PAAR motif family protein [Xanthomonas oryzae pv. oryzae]OLI89342.1 PAAR motif family protein [Xanthomonas oryzae pv. oryzae]
MRRMWIVVGDPTSGGGQVITGSRETDVDGLPVARVGDRATCRKHKGVFAIVDGDPTIIIEGQPVALDGAHLACGCTISTQRQSRNYVDLGGGTDIQSLAPPAAESTSTTMPLDKPPVCLECLLSGGSGGAPLLSRT